MRRAVSWCGFAGVVFLAGCSAEHYRASADREVAGAIAEKRPMVPNMDPEFTIEQTNGLFLGGLPVETTAPEFLGPDGQAEVGARVMSLEQALATAVRHSRAYQNSKETLYLEALALTLARHDYTPIFSGRGSVNYRVTTEDVQVGVDEITGEPGAVIAQDTELVERHRVTGEGTIGVDWLLRDLGRVTAAFTTDFLRFITGDPRTFTSSQVGATLIRPLWRDAGFKASLENLTQAERDLLYALRDFTRLRKDFTVEIVTAYYGVLQNRDAARNSYLNLEGSRRSAERTRALTAEGRATQADLGRLEQQELSTESAWINAIRAYKQSLDSFKIRLGISTDLPVVLDERELEQLKILDPGITAPDAIRVALTNRLDLQNARDRVADGERKVALAIDRLKPQLDLVASAGFSSAPESGWRFPVPDVNRYHWDAGFNVDLPFDRKAERNVYRAALIGREQAVRAWSLAEDQIKLDVREDWRRLDQARRTYEISRVAVELSERRVEEQDLLAELGRARAQDQVDAQNDLFLQKNLLTQARIEHTIARLRLWNDLGILYIKENGRWEEVTDARR